MLDVLTLERSGDGIGETARFRKGLFEPRLSDKPGAEELGLLGEGRRSGHKQVMLVLFADQPG